MLDNHDRIHFFMPGDRAEVRAALEIYVRARLALGRPELSVKTRRTAKNPSPFGPCVMSTASTARPAGADVGVSAPRGVV